VRIVLGTAVAEASIAKWRQDVLDRKLAIATGGGTVHLARYVLRDWGLEDVAAAFA
jgi:hypothetical protein